MYNPETHSPSGNPHPQYIIDYIVAFKAANPHSVPPTVWSCGNGWINFAGQQRRPSALVAMTKVLQERVA